MAPPFRGSQQPVLVPAKHHNRVERSPHPYRLHKKEILQSDGETIHPRSRSDGSLQPYNTGLDKKAQDDYITHSATPSDSDAEAGEVTYIKALPAPEVRPSKGLRNPRDDEASAQGDTPFLSPSELNEDTERSQQGYFWHHGDTVAGGERAKDATKARARFVRRRRAELLRRLSELLSLASLCAVILRDDYARAATTLHRHELIYSASVLTFFTLLYPVRLLLPRSQPKGYRLGRIRLPSAFDSAPLLYPPLIPILVALSISTNSTHAVTPNLILGLCTIPSQLIPHLSSDDSYDIFHWIMTLMPLMTEKFLPPHTSSTHSHLNLETLSLLYPFHQALMTPLHFLTTSSLLSSELQLLSVSLINLYFLSQTPQSRIFKTLIWTGGVGVFALCGRSLRENVALERIPTWRLHRASRIVRASRAFIKKVQGASQGYNDDTTSVSPERPHALLSPWSTSNDTHDADLKRRRAISDVSTNSVLDPDGTIAPPLALNKDTDGLRKVQTTPADPIQLAKSALSHTRSKSGSTNPYLSMTSGQVANRKVLHTVYIYAAIIAIVILPVRTSVANALHGWEPFGWAIGYLFGDLPAAQHYVDVYRMTDWIPLSSTVSPALQSLPVSTPNWVDHYRAARGHGNLRLGLFGYWAAVICVGLFTVLKVLPEMAEVDTRRKVFHGMMVAMLLPTAFVDPCFLSLGLILVLTVFLLLDLLRASQVKPLARPLAHFLTPYVDGRDLRGPVVVSHIFLLIGCAIPFWLSLAAYKRKDYGASSVDMSRVNNKGHPWDGWELTHQESQSRDLSMIAGVVCVGMGDSAASLIGRRYGRHKWPWAGGKSLEGSAAFAVAVTMGLMFGKLWLKVGRWQVALPTDDAWTTTLCKAWIAASGASFTEAVLTGTNDNVVVPIVLWLLVRGLGV